jgi:two-component system, cell cycle sensor histidine kinase and response regulator CckA
MIKPPAQTTILLLVSDQLVRAVTQETLESEGYLVLPAGDLGAAVDRLREIAPDLLITRLFVSNMPGHLAAKYLRTKRPGMRVLIMSGFLEDDRLADREALAGFEMFPKPYTASQFLEKVREILSKPRGQATSAGADLAPRKES